jgi:hypothetical protein
MGISCPLHNAHPFGAKAKDIILISLRNGSDMHFSLVDATLEKNPLERFGMKLKSALRQRRSKLNYRMVRLDLAWVRIYRRTACAAGLICSSQNIYRIRKGLIPREAVIVRLDPADFKEN